MTQGQGGPTAPRPGSLSRHAWREGAELLRSRVAGIPELLREELERAAPLLDPAVSRGIQRWVTSGIGSSAAHARFLAHELEQRTAVAARFVSTGSLAAGAPPGAQDAGLIVFSQGLSPNARFALAHSASWRAVVLVTAVRPDAREALDTAAGFAASCQCRGVSIVPLLDAARDEYQTLIRVIGPALGFATAISILRSLAQQYPKQTSALPLLEMKAEELCDRVTAAPQVLSQIFPRDELLAPLFERETVLLSMGGYGELVQNLAGKLLEGMGVAQPAQWDLLEFAHGGFQRIYRRKATLLVVVPGVAPGEAVGQGGQCAFEERLLAGLRAMLHPDRHDLRVLRATLPSPWSVFEHEAAFNELLLRWGDERARDPRRWPGQGQDGPLYQLAPAAPGSEAPMAASAPAAESRWSALEERSWPDLEQALSTGRRTAIVPLGSTEQHGPHLPFATDTWIAEALAERFCARVPEALRVPALALGCASEHIAFPGTLSLSADSLEGVLSDLLTSLASHGFEYAFVFSAHGGNLAAMRSMQARLCRRGDSLRPIFYTELDALVERWHQASAGFGVSAAQSGQHAGEFETSIIAALRPAAVGWSELEHAKGRTEEVEDAQSLFYPSLRTQAPNGVVGDPRGAEARRGERYLQVWVDALVEYYRAEVSERESVSGG